MGDDLGSDDEYYLDNLGLKGEKNASEFIDIVEGEESEDLNHKRKRSFDGDETPSSAMTKKKKNKKEKNIIESDEVVYTEKNKLILLKQTSNEIYAKSTEIQASFLSSCYTYFLSDTNFRKINPDTAMLPPINESEGGENSTELSKYIKHSISSMKKLKKWKTVNSPCILLVTYSARRAMKILHDLANGGNFPKIRIGKLFAKHLDINDQLKMLSTNSFGICIGTPNRILKLTSIMGDDDEEKSNDGRSGGLSLNHTEVIIFDCHLDNKRFSLFTSNDTGRDVMSFINDVVIEQNEQRKQDKNGRKPIKLGLWSGSP